MRERTKVIGQEGAGRHGVTFTWKTTAGQKIAAKYNAESRQGVAKIMRQFLEAKRKVKREYAKSKELRSAELTFEFIAYQNPDCEIKTTSKTGKPLKRKLSFHFLINGKVTIRAMRAAIKEF